MAYNVVAVLGNAEVVAQVAVQLGRDLVHGLGKPRRVADKPLVLRAKGTRIPTSGVPRVVGFPHQLRNLTRRRVGGVVLQAADRVMATGGHIAAAQVGGTAQVVALHGMDHAELVAGTGGVVLGARDRPPDCRTVVGAGLRRHRPQQRSQRQPRASKGKSQGVHKSFEGKSARAWPGGFTSPRAGAPTGRRLSALGSCKPPAARHSGSPGVKAV